jgi:hypothetical protein
MMPRPGTTSGLLRRGALTLLGVSLLALHSPASDEKLSKQIERLDQRLVKAFEQLAKQ